METLTADRRRVVDSLYGGDSLAPGALVAELARRIAYCPDRGLVIGGYQLRFNRAAWLVWSVESGRLVQVFSTNGSDGVLLSGCSPSGGPILVTGAAATAIEGWDVQTGELVWRRSDLQLAEDSSGSLEPGSAKGAPALAIQRRDKNIGFVAASTGANVVARDFKATLLAPEKPPVREWEVPPAHRLPAELRLGKHNPLGKERSPRGLADLEWLRSARPIAPHAARKMGKLHPSAAVARQLERLAAAEKLGTCAHLTLDEAQTLERCLGGADDDVLALFAIRSPALRDRWGVSLSKVVEVASNPPRYAARLPRLRVLGVRAAGANGDSTTLALHEAWNGPRIAIVTALVCEAPQPLAAWLSEVVHTFAAAPAVEAGGIDFAVVEARSTEPSPRARR
jgi:hypothetical protein